MAENPKFNNSDMFKDVTTNTGHTDIDADNKSEVLATQGNVINSIKTFWNKLRKKLVYAITRTDTSEAVGNEYIPIYVNEDGEVKQCNGFKKDIKSISNNNIIIDNLSPIIGTTLSLNVTININNPTNSLTINNKKVLYPTGVEVNAKISQNTNLLVVYNGDIWILINKMNEVTTSGKTSENSAGGDGHSGLMTADDKAKLETIDWDANKYTLPTASTTVKGGVILGANQVTKLDTPNSSTTIGRYYPIQTDKNNKLVVNVPWSDTNDHDTARITVGTIDTGQNNQTNGTQSTYINIIDNDGGNISHIIVKGDGDTTVSSTTNGELVISSPTVNTYSRLDVSDKNPLIGYTIKGAGDNANTYHYLAGDGTWVNGRLVPNTGTIGQILKWGSSGPYWANDTE